ncbi:unnamed protein product [Schistosoma margrebowiei]|uniref:Vps16_C domain-containing protein n=1 Tax=Schistosoma margrebowiei TaxID=48269 RepID=A0AA84ZIW6_9TREM|nr:unnamed protein product [Schistosoma margrebowiei]
MSDDIWEESAVKGFQFDLEEADNTSTYSHILGDSFGETFCDESITIDFNNQFCTICHNLIGNEIYYEKDATFCSEACWLKAITIALDDFVVGGMSTWPLSTFVSQSSKSVILNLTTSTYDGNLITKIVNELRNSLSESTFENILLKNPVAAFHFLNFLRNTGQLVDLKKYMKILGFIRESEISDEQFRWLLIEPLVQSRNWNDLEFIMLKKKSLSRRMEVTIPNDRFILHLNSLGVPNNIIESYLKYLSDDEFIQIVIRLNMVDEAVKLCLEKRNINALKELMSQIPGNHQKKKEISHYLSVPVAQWKDFVCRQAF